MIKSKSLPRNSIASVSVQGLSLSHLQGCVEGDVVEGEVVD
jgi:hypothetical protein